MTGHSKIDFFSRVSPISKRLFGLKYNMYLKRPSLRLFRFKINQFVPFLHFFHDVGLRSAAASMLFLFLSLFGCGFLKYLSNRFIMLTKISKNISATKKGQKEEQQKRRCGGRPASWRKVVRDPKKIVLVIVIIIIMEQADFKFLNARDKHHKSWKNIHNLMTMIILIISIKNQT